MYSAGALADESQFSISTPVQKNERYILDNKKFYKAFTWLYKKLTVSWWRILQQGSYTDLIYQRRHIHLSDGGREIIFFEDSYKQQNFNERAVFSLALSGLYAALNYSEVSR